MSRAPARQSVDVLVIGLGPAGGAAALAAARGGLKVAAVERRRTVGVPVQCAGFIPLPLGKYAQGSGVLKQRISGMKTMLPSGAAEHTEFPGLMIDRALFDQALAQQAGEAGARLWLGSRLAGLDAERALARISTPEGEREIEYRLLVAADGPHSFVAGALGLPPLETVHARQYTVPLRHACADTHVWLSDAYPGGYAWLFPRGALANLGLGLDRRLSGNLKQPLDELHRRLFEQGVVGARIGCRTGGAIPVGGLRARLAVGGVLFAGDAAGLTHPITGAGIHAAVVSGERAGEAAVRFLGGQPDALEAFEEDVRDQFGAVLDRAVMRRRWLAQRWHTAAAHGDAMHRRGWIAFPEYFSAGAELSGDAEKEHDECCG